MRENYYPRVTVDLKKLRNNVDQILETLQGAEHRGCRSHQGMYRSSQMCPSLCGRRMFLRSIFPIGTNRGCQELWNRQAFHAHSYPHAQRGSRCHSADGYQPQQRDRNLEGDGCGSGKQGKVHQVILMVDLGDLREGFWDKEELLEAALMVENDLPNLELAGVGTNLGCYGSINATADKLNELIADAEMIEEKIGRQLRYIAGGATTSIPRLLEGDMPERINLLRIGEGIILGKDLRDLWG